MFVNDLKTGMRVKMASIPEISGKPRIATIEDNRTGVIRTVLVEGRDGYDEEAGSAWIDEILAVEQDGAWEPVEMTDVQRATLLIEREY